MAGPMTEISVQHGLDLSSPCKNGTPEFLKVCTALIEGERTCAQEGGALLGEDFAHASSAIGDVGIHVRLNLFTLSWTCTL